MSAQTDTDDNEHLQLTHFFKSFDVNQMSKLSEWKCVCMYIII